MASCKYLGIDSDTPPVLDTGTTCIQLSPVPVVAGVFMPVVNAYPRSILVGESKRKPGENSNGTPAEDMQYGDKRNGDQTSKIIEMIADGIISGGMLLKSPDAVLERSMEGLMTSVSTGEMETVALEMYNKFIKGTKGNYKSKILNRIIGKHPAFVKYDFDFNNKLNSLIKSTIHRPHSVKPILMDDLDFSSFWDKVGGLGITIHQVWSIKAELIDFSISDSGRWSATLKYTLYDHFGLDLEDIKKHGNDTFPSEGTGLGFCSWYILQHYRKAKPFITEVNVLVRFGNIPPGYQLGQYCNYSPPLF